MAKSLHHGATWQGRIGQSDQEATQKGVQGEQTSVEVSEVLKVVGKQPRSLPTEAMS